MHGCACSPADVLCLERPATGYLCPLESNPGIEFLSFEIKDYDSGKAVYQSHSGPVAPSEELRYPYPTDEDAMRSVQYTFPAEFLTFKTIRTSLNFKVGSEPLNNFRMIEIHYFKGLKVRTYDFTFGFCIPNSVNSWEAIYDVPTYTRAELLDYVGSPFGHTSDSYYFVDDRLVMHNKAQYQYA